MKNNYTKKLSTLFVIFTLVLSFAVCGSAAATSAEGAASPAEYTIRFDLNTTPETTDDELYVYEETGYDEYW